MSDTTEMISLQLLQKMKWPQLRPSEATSFLLKKDYKVHTPVVRELLNSKYDDLACIECSAYKLEKNQKKLIGINKFLNDYYGNIKREVTERDIKGAISDTLITKILMGTLGCVPAYDRFFISGIGNLKVATKKYNINSILKLVDFYERYAYELESVINEMEVCGMRYPQMKLIDMVFWLNGSGLVT